MSSIGSRGEIWRESRNSLNLEDEKFLDSTSSFSWTGPNALARSSLLERQEKLQLNCEEIQDKEIRREIVDLEEFHNILVDEQHKLLYCYVPKVNTPIFFSFFFFFFFLYTFCTLIKLMYFNLMKINKSNKCSR